MKNNNSGMSEVAQEELGRRVSLNRSDWFVQEVQEVIEKRNQFG